MANKKLLRDASGVYLLGAVASIHPLNIRGDKTDQNKITEVHTRIASVGGQTHTTTIPFDEALKAFEDFHEPPAQEPRKE